MRILLEKRGLLSSSTGTITIPTRGAMKYKIKLKPTEARSLLLWNYHANDNHPEVVCWNMAKYISKKIVALAEWENGGFCPFKMGL